MRKIAFFAILLQVMLYLQKGYDMKNLKIDFNAPVVLSVTFISFAMLCISTVFGEGVYRMFGIYYTSFLSPLMYMRMFTHIFMHANWAHFAGNFMLILAIGPMVEEKYGSARLAVMGIITAFVTGLVNVVFFPGTLLIGASGIVFMLILLSSFVNVQEGKFPLTVILVAFFFIGNEILNGVMSSDNISQMGHILGGLCGGGFGMVLSGVNVRLGKKKGS